MRVLLFFILSLSLLLPFCTVPLNAQSNGLQYWIDRVQAWHKAVLQHKPGETDSAALEIGSWPEDDLEFILWTVCDLSRQRTGRKRQVAVQEYFIATNRWKNFVYDYLGGRYRFAPKNLQDFRKFDQAFAEIIGPANKLDSFLIKAALLHSDIRLLHLDLGAVSTVSLAAISNTNDGLSMVENKERHWTFARFLINSTAPNPSNDEMARIWYIATTSSMLGDRSRAFAEPNLKDALALFPNDPLILFLAGILHEGYANPRTQHSLAPLGYSFGFGLKDLELDLALKYLRQAVDKKMEFPEAHLRMGRIKGLRGKHEAAVKELQGALESISSRQLKYYAYLFLGQEFADLDQKGEARQCFEIAARLFPSAPSPLLSMSRLSYEEGDFKSALNRIERLFEPLVQYSAYDPWWDYDRTHGFDTDALIEEMRRKLGGLSE